MVLPLTPRIAVYIFNKGVNTVKTLTEEMGIVPDAFTCEFLEDKDASLCAHCPVAGFLNLEGIQENAGKGRRTCGDEGRGGGGGWGIPTW